MGAKSTKATKMTGSKIVERALKQGQESNKGMEVAQQIQQMQQTQQTSAEAAEMATLTSQLDNAVNLANFFANTTNDITLKIEGTKFKSFLEDKPKFLTAINIILNIKEFVALFNEILPILRRAKLILEELKKQNQEREVKNEPTN
jgi:hypothetical protein